MTIDCGLFRVLQAPIVLCLATEIYVSGLILRLQSNKNKKVFGIANLAEFLLCFGYWERSITILQDKYEY